MSDLNKVEFGLKNVHVGTYTANEATGVVTMGTPYKLPGAVNLSLDPETEEVKSYADDVIYYADYSDNGFSGSLEMMRFPDEYKLKFCGFIQLDDGGIAQSKYATRPNLYIAFEGDGDKEKRRGILYNVRASVPSREHKTKEGSNEPNTESCDLTVMGDNATGLTRVYYPQSADGYDTLFTNPPAPQLPVESE